MTYVLNQNFTVSMARIITKDPVEDTSGEWPPKPSEECFIEEEVRLPASCRGYIVEGEDGSFDICVNPNSPIAQDGETVIHEMDHGRNGHLYNAWMTVEEKEKAAYNRS